MTDNSADYNESVINALGDLNENTVATNDSIKALQEYLIIQENKRVDEKNQDANNAEAIEESKLSAEEDARQEANDQAETYTELLTDIRDQIQLTNQLLTVNGLYIGIVVGLLTLKILFDRIFK